MMAPAMWLSAGAELAASVGVSCWGWRLLHARLTNVPIETLALRLRGVNYAMASQVVDGLSDGLSMAGTLHISNVCFDICTICSFHTASLSLRARCTNVGLYSTPGDGHKIWEEATGMVACCV
jgi:hypothetical protein